MAELVDVLKTPQGIGMLLSGLASAGTGNQQYIQTNLLLQDRFDDMRKQREGLELRKRRQDAFARLPGLMEPLAADADPAMAADRRRETWALLADIAPEETAKGLIGSFFKEDKANDPRTSTDFNDLANMLGRRPTQEEMVKYKSAGGGGSATQLDMILKGLQIQKTQQDLATGADARGDKIDEKDKKFAVNQTALTRNFDRIKHLADLAEKTRGTFVEPGAVADVRRQLSSGASMVGRWAGVDTKKLEKDVSDSELLSKGLNVIVQDTLERFGSNISDGRQKLLQAASANPSMKTDSIRELLGDVAQELQDQADIYGYDVDREAMGGFIESMRTPLPPLENDPVIDVPGAVNGAKAAAGRAADATGKAVDKAAAAGQKIVRRAADIARLGKAQIEQIDPAEVSEWTAEQRAALDKRMRELGF